MYTSRVFLLLLTAFFLVVVLLGTVRLVRRPFRRITEIPYKDSTAYAIWFGGIVAMLAAAFMPAANVLLQAVELLYGSTAGSHTPANAKTAFMSGLKTAGILVLLAAVWFWTWYLFGSYITRAVTGKANPVTEMELDNKVYFGSKYLLILLCMLVLLPFYISALSYFLPDINSPFYR